jgi:hypothetical protein
MARIHDYLKSQGIAYEAGQLAALVEKTGVAISSLSDAQIDAIATKLSGGLAVASTATPTESTSDRRKNRMLAKRGDRQAAKQNQDDSIVLNVKELVAKEDAIVEASIDEASADGVALADEEVTAFTGAYFAQKVRRQGQFQELAESVRAVRSSASIADSVQKAVAESQESLFDHPELKALFG